MGVILVSYPHNHLYDITTLRKQKKDMANAISY